MTRDYWEGAYTRAEIRQRQEAKRKQDQDMARKEALRKRGFKASPAILADPQYVRQVDGRRVVFTLHDEPMSKTQASPCTRVTMTFLWQDEPCQRSPLIFWPQRRKPSLDSMLASATSILRAEKLW